MQGDMFTIHFNATATRWQLSRLIKDKVEPLTTDATLKKQLNETLWHCMQKYNGAIPEETRALRDNTAKDKGNQKRVGNTRVNSKGIVFDAIAYYSSEKKNTSHAYHYAGSAFMRNADAFSLYLQTTNGEGPVFVDFIKMAKPIIIERMKKRK